MNHWTAPASQQKEPEKIQLRFDRLRLAAYVAVLILMVCSILGSLWGLISLESTISSGNPDKAILWGLSLLGSVLIFYLSVKNWRMILPVPHPQTNKFISTLIFSYLCLAVWGVSVYYIFIL